MARKIVQDAFRFVSVRSPKPISSRTLKYAFVSYNTQTPSELFKNLSSIAQTKDGLLADKRRQLAGLVDNMRTKGLVMQDYDQLASKFSAHLLMSEYMSSATELSIDSFVKGVKSASLPNLNADELNLLWDVVFADLFLKGDAYLVQAAIKTLKLDFVYKHILGGAEPSKDAELLKETMSAVLVMPKALTLRGMPAPVEVATPRNFAAEKLAAMDTLLAVKQEIEALQVAQRAEAVRLQELVAKSQQVEIQESSDSAKKISGKKLTPAELEKYTSQIENHDVLTAAQLDKLSDTAKKTLSELRINAGSSLGKITEQLSQAAQKMGTEAASSLTAFEPVAQLNNEVIMQKGLTYGGLTPAPHQDINIVNPGERRLQMLSVADLKVLKQQFIEYQPGEIAHIENVLSGERKTRKTRRLSRYEEQYLYATENSREEERDTQSTDRYELSKEISRIVRSETASSTRSTTPQTNNSRYGTPILATEASSSTSSGSTTANNSAETYAKELVQRASERIYNRVVEQRSTNQIEEFEERNKHEIDNLAGTDNKVGIYRWVDKHYSMQLEDYGKKMYCNMMIPEPAALYIHKETTNAESKQAALQCPLNPTRSADMGRLQLPVLTPYLDIEKYFLFAQLYGIELPERPAMMRRCGEKTISIPNDWATAAPYLRTECVTDINVPDGYEAIKVYIDGTLQRPSGMGVGAGCELWCMTHVGGSGNTRWSQAHINFSIMGACISPLVLDKPLENNVPISFIVRGLAVINIDIEIVPTAATLQKWKDEAYFAILAAYREQKETYEERLEELLYEANNVENQYARNRMIEQHELYKGCVQILSDSVSTPTTRAMTTDAGAGYSYPSFEPETAFWDSKTVQFFETAFEWDSMTYSFAPYFYGRKNKWLEFMNRENADLLFQTFLQSGAASVSVPVRTGYERAVVYFLEHGVIWNGDLSLVPMPESRFAADLVSEFTRSSASPLPTTWEVDIPTNLVILQAAPNMGTTDTIVI